MSEDLLPARDRRHAYALVGVVAVVALLGLGAWALAPRLSSAPGHGGPDLAIAVVAPVEPVPVAGSVMEVGLLNDGFDRAALERQPELTASNFIPPDAYVGEDWPPLDYTAPSSPMIRPVAVVTEPTVTTTDPLADGSRLFGFDRPPARSTPPSADAPVDTVEVRSEPSKRSDAFFE